MLLSFCLSEKEVLRLWLWRCNQSLPSSRYLGQSSLIWCSKRIHVRIFFCEFKSQINDVRWWDEQSSEGQCIIGWRRLWRVRCLHEGLKVCWALGSHLSHIIPPICSKSLCIYFLWFRSIFSFNRKISRVIDFCQTLSGTSVDNEDKLKLFINQRVRVRPPCISVDVKTYSDRLHFWTTGEFLNEDLWDRFGYEAALERQSWWPWM
jgi:hypothetical protein